MTDIGTKLSFRKQVEQEAISEALKEKTKEAKEALVRLYKKQEGAKQILKNIQNEIDDYLMTLEKE